MQGFLKEFRRRCGASVDERGARYLDRIEHGAVRLNAVIHDFVMLSRVIRPRETPQGCSLRTLLVNAVADGSLTAELLDAAGKPIAGFGRADCIPITGDQLDHVVTWKRGSSVARLEGKPIKIKFHLNRTHMYAFRFADAKREALQ